MTRTVDVRDVATHLPRLQAEVEAGGDVVIGRAGRPVARLVPFATSRPRRVPGAWKGKGWIADDFDDLPEEVAASLEADLVGGADTGVGDDDVPPATVSPTSFSRRLVNRRAGVWSCPAEASSARLPGIARR